MLQAVVLVRPKLNVHKLFVYTSNGETLACAGTAF